MANPSQCSTEELLAHLQSAVEDVFQTMLNTMVTLIEPGAGEPEPKPALPGSCEAHQVQIEAVVEFRGPSNGAVVLQCTAEGATDIARGLLMLDAGSSVSLSEVRDAIGECANMVTGSLKMRAFDPYGKFTLGVPRFNEGHSLSRAQRAGQLRFRMSEGCAAIEIWMEEPAA